MAVISTFDQWKKDVFFSAAEEVQESADTMESVYRMWIRGCIDGCEAEFLDELRRELHTTLGTAKWQLEEFERAVSLAHGNYLSSDNAILRHREFIAAIRNKISHIEKAINDSLHKEGKQPLRWVQLDDQERDDFENFLSMAPPKLQASKDKHVDPESVRGFKETVTISKDAYVVEVASKDDFGIRSEVKLQEENLQSSSDIGAWKIVIADEEDVDKKLVESRPEVHYSASIDCGFLRILKSTARLKWFKNSFRKVKSGDHIQSRQGISTYLDMKGIALLNKGLNGLTERSRSCFSSFKESPNGYSLHQVRRFGGLQRHFLVSQSNKCSLRVALLLMVTIFFIVPFVLYST